jgi:excisionase family DNA binding protein
MSIASKEKAMSCPQQTMTPKELAKALQVSVRTLQNHTRSGNIPHIRIGNSYRYPIEILADLLTEKASE